MSACGGSGGGNTASNSVDCTAGSNTGPVIYATDSTSALPAATGVAVGQTILEGTYYRTATTYYGQPFPQVRPDPLQGTLIISGNTIEDIERQPSPSPEFRLGAIFAVSGTNISYTVKCSTETSMVGQTLLGPFSYSNGVLKTYDTNTKKESVLTWQY
jgi:hypothetical protein